jgi:D-beta-D-heptose 7-phosphate kinase/D-beta-D-heptose 1-phosphate adenosyltransferase
VTRAARPARPRKLATKIKSARALKLALAKTRKGRNVVFTNGTFDILHPGHVRYLESARAQGDVLVVALNTDESVRRYKGPERPINSLKDRLEVMAALECVDWVTWFDEDLPLNTILALRPDVLVKGGDWSIQDISGGPEVKAWGGKVKSLQFVEGKSTTAIIQRSKGPQSG